MLPQPLLHAACSIDFKNTLSTQAVRMAPFFSPRLNPRLDDLVRGPISLLSHRHSPDLIPHRAFSPPQTHGRAADVARGGDAGVRRCAAAAAPASGGRRR